MAIKNDGNQPHKPQHQHPTMDDKKIDKLKSLNALLVKETVDLRQHVESLVQSKNSLESEFNLSVMDNDSLRLEMNALVETASMLEIEIGVAFVFMNQMADETIGCLEEKSEFERSIRAKESEIGDLKRRLKQVLVDIDEERGVLARVVDERDEIRTHLDDRILEVDELRLKLIEAESKEAQVLTKVAELKANYDRLTVENIDFERRIESIMKERDDLQTGLIESNGVVDELKRSIAELLEQKNVIAAEKTKTDGKNSELQALVDELKKMVESMKIKEGTLQKKFDVLEKKHAASLKNEVEKKIEINELVEEKKETELRIERLVKEKGFVAKALEDAMKELEQQKLLMNQVVQEKTKLEDVKIEMESEIVNMKTQLSVFKDIISSLEMCSANQIQKVKELEVEVGTYKSSFDQAGIERDEAIRQLNDENTITSDFKQKFTVMLQEVEDLNEKLATLTTENGKHLGEKKQLEDQCAGLVKEVAVLEARFAESRIEFVGKVDAAEANLKRVLHILKKTVLTCDVNSDVDHKNGVVDGIEEHVAGIEAIKRVLKDKESRLEEMKMQIELVKNSAAEARKEKSFWTMVSSATTLLAAAASLAFVARSH
ncbi:hypothetical protein E3N88_33838 [Mikania micrantha]|uniref:Uncharacterized protein n=1 Tax=Mikania micrantha TaxID=192012 RepID=A0A5N6MCU1_9ASTR|nr:hypothetical protein E3N88_33838 [Mikania micrantha]